MYKIYWVHLAKMSIDNILGTVYNNLNIKQNNPTHKQPSSPKSTHKLKAIYL